MIFDWFKRCSIMFITLNPAGKYNTNHNAILTCRRFLNNTMAPSDLPYANAIKTPGINHVFSGYSADTIGFNSVIPIFNANNVVIASDIPA